MVGSSSQQTDTLGYILYIYSSSGHFMSCVLFYIASMTYVSHLHKVRN